MMGKNQEATKVLRVAAIQVESKHGSPKENYANATPFIEQAAREGAQLVVLPELFASGYIPNKSLWDSAEPHDGPTTTWLKQTSKRLGIYLGAGLIESDGADFYNVFVITTPEGEIAGRAQKNNAEAYCFRRGHGEHIINTAIAKIGVGICADNHYTSFLQQLRGESIDILLMPHGAPTPYKTTKSVSAKDILQASEDLKALPRLYSSLLGIPVVFVNGVGPMAKMTGLLGKLMTPEAFRLQGLSQIVDADGSVKAEMESEEGIVVTDVVLDPGQHKYVEPKDYDGWLHPGSVLLRKVILPADIAFASWWYRFSRERSEKALLVKNVARCRSGLD